MAFIIVRPSKSNTATTTTHQQRVVSESPYCAIQRSNLFHPMMKVNHRKLSMTYYDRGDSDNNDEDNDTDDVISNEDDDFYDLYYDKYMSEQVVSSKANKMEIIRSLQSSFYAEDATKEEEEEKKESTHHDDHEEDENRISDTGKITRLPLWRVPWTELPGRSNILNVHEPTYTHMFETVLRKSSSSTKNGCYVGHLHLSGGSKNMKTNAESDEYRLYSFPLEEERKAERKSTTIVGTLLRIVDYVRVNDGRLLLLVQGLERFVITKVHQEYPYSIVDVQLLPDISMDDDDEKKKKNRFDNNFDVEKDFQLVELPIRNKDKRKTREVEVVDMFDIMGTANLKKLLPFVPFSSQRSQVYYYSEIDDEQPQTIQQQQQHNQTTSTMKSFYNRLVDSSILKDSSTLPSLANNMDNISNEELERSIWICIDEFFRTKFGPHWIDDYYHATTDITSTTAISTKEKKKLDQIKKNLKCLSTLPLPLELLTLFPANSSWPSNFLLDDLVNALVSYTTTTNDNNNTKETNEVIIVSDKHDMLSRFINPSALFHSTSSTSSKKELVINEDEETSVVSRKRQTRLSYSASYMLENSLSSITLSNFAQSLQQQQQKQHSTKNDKESKENDGDITNNNIDIKTKLRQTLLEVSTTRERLMLLLDLYRQLNIEIMGEFW